MIGTVVIKAVRACNLRCPYCYYINEQTTDYGRVIAPETLERLYEHVAEYLGGRRGFSFVWHGGEPLILGRPRFRRFLDLQRDYFAPEQVQNHVQTNGVLVDQAWVDFFRDHRVGVGISIDSTPEAHDRNRVTTRGAGTYARVVEAIRLFQRNGQEVGTIAVADAAADGAAAIDHLRDLGVPVCDFLIPMTNNALEAGAGAAPLPEPIDFSGIGAFLAGAFRRWVERPEPLLSVRLFECVIRNALGIPSGYLDAGSTNLSDFLVVETDGALCLDPDFWHIDRFGLGARYRLAMSVHDPDFSLAEAGRRVDAFAREQHLDALPDDCQRCKVRSACRGSHPASRYGPDGSFNHRSAYCEAMFALCDAAIDFLVESGHADLLVDDDLRAHLRRTQASRGAAPCPA